MIAAHRQCRRSEPLFTEEHWRRIARNLEFSGRELEVTRLIFQNERDEAIGRELCISVSSVQTHIKRLYRKLGVVNRMGLALEIFREHLAALQSTQQPEPVIFLQPRARRAA